MRVLWMSSFVNESYFLQGGVFFSADAYVLRIRSRRQQLRWSRAEELRNEFSYIEGAVSWGSSDRVLSFGIRLQSIVSCWEITVVACLWVGTQLVWWTNCGWSRKVLFESDNLACSVRYICYKVLKISHGWRGLACELYERWLSWYFVPHQPMSSGEPTTQSIAYGTSELVPAKTC